MAVTIEPVRLQDAQVAEAGAVLGRAFFDDPLFVWAFPDDGTRTRLLTPMMEVGVRIGYLYGEVYTSGGAVEGAAVWRGPDSGELTPERMEATGYPAVAAQFDPLANTRFGTAFAMYQRLHERAVPEPHWYLNILGVEPARQGMGIGGQLVAPILARADAAGLPCYLETHKARNVPFYRKHGFEVVVEDVLPDGPPIWTMLRRPRA